MRHFKKSDPRLWEAFQTLPKAELVRVDERMSKAINAGAFFADVCETIIGQQLSGKAARTIYERFVTLVVQVTPRAVSKLTIGDMRGVGISNAKARALLDLAERVLAGTLRLDDIATVPDGELRDRLIAVRGIGPWTAEMLLMFTLMREDVFSPGDLGLQKGVQIVYGLKRLPTPQEMMQRSLSWSPYRTYAALLLWRLVDTRKQVQGALKSTVRRNGVT